MAFGKDLRELRIRAHVSQTTLAKLADIDHSTVSRLEAGTRRPTRAMIDSLATALHATPEQRNRLYNACGFMYNDVVSSERVMAHNVLTHFGYDADLVKQVDTIWQELMSFIETAQKARL